VLIVKKLVVVAIVIAAGICQVSILDAQEGAARKVAPSGNRIAVIDISHIFKNHAGFKQAMDGMKKEVEAFEAELRKRGKEIEGLREQMRNFKSGSPEYKGIEEKMAKRAADGQAQTQLKRRDFLEREAKIYYDIYMEIGAAVAQFSQRNGISLVVRFNSAPIEGTDRNSVLEGVNRAVVFQQNLNITPMVLQMLNRRVADANKRAPVKR
jgi:Skp family chaperone for outer membrane proteins